MGGPQHQGLGEGGGDGGVGEVVLHRGSTYLRVDREVANTDWALDAGDAPLVVGTYVVAKVLGDNRARCIRTLDSPDERRPGETP